MPVLLWVLSYLGVSSLLDVRGMSYGEGSSCELWFWVCCSGLAVFSDDKHVPLYHCILVGDSDTCPSLLPIFQGINEGPASLQGSPPDPVLVLLLCLLGAKLSPHLDRR